MGWHNWIAPTDALRLKRMKERRGIFLEDSQGNITHVVYVIDASSSMQGREADVVRVVDGQTQFLASMPDTDHEVRVTVYQFSTPGQFKCLVYEKDVLRLPSIEGTYRPDGWTALLDATGQAIEDLKMTPTKYGKHSFLIFVFTDGQENQSRVYNASSMHRLLSGLGDEWTVAALVPDVNGKLLMQRFGFAKGNVAVWDVNSTTGVEEAGQQMKAALGTYMTGRATGIVGTRALFDTSADAVNAATIKAAGLQPLKAGTYDLIKVTKIRDGEGTLNKDKVKVWELADFLRHNGLPFVLGRNFYLLRKKERIAGDKELVVLEKSTNKVFAGDGVRAMIGLTDKTQSVAADFNKDYAIFVQSKSNNRHLFNGDEIIVLR